MEEVTGVAVERECGKNGCPSVGTTVPEKMLVTDEDESACMCAGVGGGGVRWWGGNDLSVCGGAQESQALGPPMGREEASILSFPL